MLLSNTLIYNHQLVCGSADVANSRLLIPHWESMTYPHHEWWLQSTLDPANPVIFLNTDKARLITRLIAVKRHHTLPSLILSVKLVRAITSTMKSKHIS